MRLPLANAERYFRAAASERQTALSRKSHGIDAELFQEVTVFVAIDVNLTRIGLLIV